MISEPLALAAFRAQEEALLSSYGWVEKDKGLARIPIDDAMRLVAEHGLPKFAPAAAAPPLRRPAAAAPAAERPRVTRTRSLALLLALAPALGSAQMGAVPPPPPATPGMLPQIGFDQHLGGSVPLDLAFTRRGGPRRQGSATTSARSPSC